MPRFLLNIRSIRAEHLFLTFISDIILNELIHFQTVFRGRLLVEWSIHEQYSSSISSFIQTKVLYFYSDYSQVGEQDSDRKHPHSM